MRYLCNPSSAVDNKKKSEFREEFSVPSSKGFNEVPANAHSLLPGGFWTSLLYYTTFNFTSSFLQSRISLSRKPGSTDGTLHIMHVSRTTMHICLQMYSKCFHDCMTRANTYRTMHESKCNGLYCSQVQLKRKYLYLFNRCLSVSCKMLHLHTFSRCFSTFRNIITIVARELIHPAAVSHQSGTIYYRAKFITIQCTYNEYVRRRNP